jgi:hypothetical protein
MSKSKSKKGKSPNKAQPLSGMVVKSSSAKGSSKGSAFVPNQSISSAKKGGATNTTPRKAS